MSGVISTRTIRSSPTPSLRGSDEITTLACGLTSSRTDGTSIGEGPRLRRRSVAANRVPTVASAGPVNVKDVSMNEGSGARLPIRTGGGGALSAVERSGVLVRTSCASTRTACESWPASTWTIATGPDPSPSGRNVQRTSASPGREQRPGIADARSTRPPLTRAWTTTPVATSGPRFSNAIIATATWPRPIAPRSKSADDADIRDPCWGPRGRCQAKGDPTGRERQHFPPPHA